MIATPIVSAGTVKRFVNGGQRLHLSSIDVTDFWVAVAAAATAAVRSETARTEAHTASVNAT
jgi:hypothetical protein